MSKSHSGEFLVVRLSGFIHTDDKLALKDIWRQLGKEMDVDDDLMNRVCLTVQVDSRVPYQLTIFPA